MAGHLPKEISQFHKIPGAKIAIVASSWHASIVNQMIKTCIEELTKLHASAVKVHILPGSLELPLAARILFEKETELEAIIAFGVVLKGDTTHDSTVIEYVNQGFTLASERFGKPIINEVIGVRDIVHAEARAQSKGIEACYAVSEFINWKLNI